MGSGNALSFSLTTKAGVAVRQLTVQKAIIAGWTARDIAAMEKHIKELEEIGVVRPATTPIYYRVGAARITTADSIQATGGDSSGEVEFVIATIDGKLWIGAGSDHTDRKVEIYNITVSKQMCDKPVAAALWPWEEVADHWDSLILRSHAVIGGKRELYQDGKVAAMRTPLDLIEGYNSGQGAFDDGSIMFGGTLAAKGGIRSAERFEFELVDEKLGRRIAHGYNIEPLPVLG
jgi:uncharacterized protein DUF2848